MSWKGFFKGAGNVLVGLAPIGLAVATTVVPGGSIAQRAVIPLIGSVVNAIAAARHQGGTGQDQFAEALKSLQVAAPSIISEIEAMFNIDLPEEAYEPYVKALIQAHYDLLKASGKIASASTGLPQA